MSTRNVSSKRADSTVAAEVLARRTSTTGSRAEVYGAETLPVLIRLPDLTLVNRPLHRLSESVAQEEVAKTVTAPMETAPASPPRREREPKVAGVAGRDRNEYLGRRMRRGMREDSPVGWLHGVRQFLVAAVLAGILLAVIVTIKEWNRAAPKPTSAVPREQAEASKVEFGQPELAPAANASFEQQIAPLDTVQQDGHMRQDVVPAGMLSFDSGQLPANTTNSDQPSFPATVPDYSAGYASPSHVADQPVAPDAAGYADGASQAAGSYGNYPTTGVAPVRVGTVPTSPAAGATWPFSQGPPSPVRSAARGPSDVHSRQR